MEKLANDKTSLEEVTKIVYDTDLYEKVRRISSAGKHQTSLLFNEIVAAINTHYQDHLKRYEAQNEERKAFLYQRIESELNYYD